MVGTASTLRHSPASGLRDLAFTSDLLTLKGSSGQTQGMLVQPDGMQACMCMLMNSTTQQQMHGLSLMRDGAEALTLTT